MDTATIHRVVRADWRKGRPTRGPTVKERRLLQVVHELGVAFSQEKTIVPGVLGARAVRDRPRAHISAIKVDARLAQSTDDVRRESIAVIARREAGHPRTLSLAAFWVCP